MLLFVIDRRLFRYQKVDIGSIVFGKLILREVDIKNGLSKILGFIIIVIGFELGEMIYILDILNRMWCIKIIDKKILIY